MKGFMEFADTENNSQSNNCCEDYSVGREREPDKKDEKNTDSDRWKQFSTSALINRFVDRMEI